MPQVPCGIASGMAHMYWCLRTVLSSIALCFVHQNNYPYTQQSNTHTVMSMLLLLFFFSAERCCIKVLHGLCLMVSSFNIVYTGCNPGVND